MISYKNRRNNTFKFVKTFLNYIQTATNNAERAQAVQQFKQQFQDLNYEVMQAEQNQNVTLQDSASDFKWVLEFMGALHTNSLKWEITLKRVNDFKNMVNTIQSGGNAKFMSLYNNPQTSDQWKEWMRYLYKDVIDYENKNKDEKEQEQQAIDRWMCPVLKALAAWDDKGEAVKIVDYLIERYGNQSIKIDIMYKIDILKDNVIGPNFAVDLGVKENILGYDKNHCAYSGKLKNLFQLYRGEAQKLARITKSSKYIDSVKAYVKGDESKKISEWVEDKDLTNRIYRLIQLLGDQTSNNADRNFQLFLINQVADDEIDLDINTYKFVVDTCIYMLKDKGNLFDNTAQSRVSYSIIFRDSEKDFYRKMLNNNTSSEKVKDDSAYLLYELSKQQKPLNDIKFLVYMISLALAGYRFYIYKPNAFMESFGIFGKLFSNGNNHKSRREFKKVHLDYADVDLDIGNIQINDFLQYYTIKNYCEPIVKCLNGDDQMMLCILTPGDIDKLQKNPEYIRSIPKELKGKDQTFYKLYNKLGTESIMRLCFNEGLSADLITVRTAQYIKAQQRSAKKRPDVSSDMKI